MAASDKRIIVAIDGPAGAGKSTIARAVAGKLGFLYLDTGAMYRVVGLVALRENIDLADAPRLTAIAEFIEIELHPEEHRVLANGEDVTADIRRPEVSAAASRVSAVAGVRRALVEKQRAMASVRSVVMEGRDIGTVVFPDAHVKVFLDATGDVRAERRVRELEQRGVPVDPARTRADIEERDERDRGRDVAPLLQAPDATYLDTSGLALAEVEERILALVRARLGNGKEPHR